MAEGYLRELRDMQATGTLCDVVVKGAEDSSAGIPCHRNILSVCSKYFRAVLVNYAYTLEIKIDVNNARSILTAALFLEIPAVVTLCWDVVEEHMDITSCLMVHRFVDRHTKAQLAARAKAMVLCSFLRISRSAEFLLVDADKLVELIASDDLRVGKEDNVLEAVVRWLEHDPAGRKALVSDVLQFVRFVFLSSAAKKYFLFLFNGFITTPADPSSVPFGIAQTVPNCLAKTITSESRPRESYDLAKAIVCVGELKSGEKKTHMYIFIPSTSLVMPLTNLPENIDAAALAMLPNGLILVCGGRSKPLSECRVWQYDATGFAWTDLEPMGHKRYGAGVVALNGRIYAMGDVDLRAGTRGRSVTLSSMEVYDPEGGKWEFVASLPITLVDFAVLACANRLYVFGGESANREEVNRVYCYDPVGDVWSRMADMSTERRCCTACVGTSGQIYVIGGSADADEAGHCGYLVEAYDTATNQWCKKKNMLVSRHSAVSACVGGAIYVVGGVDERADYVENTSIECYDEDTDTWTLHSCQMPEERVLTGCAVMPLNTGTVLANGNVAQCG
ncbi:kelch-like protein 5 [Paramacrobiotus metropolitanus]|uniref:kelch-like protein 5 n=1 Tax=Paramacrobiotus metropolitanus TaxID=2943436 RepID=UPI002445641D|nr:kelch-like protein 5 [Paramacrobiotus metropolitanus]